MFLKRTIYLFFKKKRISAPKKNWVVEIKTKRDGFIQQANSIEIIAIGSSHGAYAFNPEHFLNVHAYNFCSASQDLYYSSMILEKSLQIAHKCKQVILFYSVFSVGFDLEKSSEKSRCIAFFELWNIPPQSKCASLCQSGKLISFKLQPILINTDYRGYDNPQKFFNSIPLSKRIEAHLKHNERAVDQHAHLKSMIDLVGRRGIDFIIVLSPVHSDYREFIRTNYGKTSKQLFSSIYALVQTNPGVYLLDYYACKFLSDSHFGDYDHLNSLGAKSFTLQLHKDVSKLCLQKSGLLNI